MSTSMLVQTTLQVTQKQLRGLLIKTGQFKEGLALLKDPDERSEKGGKENDGPKPAWGATGSGKGGVGKGE